MIAAGAGATRGERRLRIGASEAAVKEGRQASNAIDAALAERVEERGHIGARVDDGVDRP